MDKSYLAFVVANKAPGGNNLNKITGNIHLLPCNARKERDELGKGFEVLAVRIAFLPKSETKHLCEA